MKGFYLTTALFSAASAASRLYTASYAGTIATLELGKSHAGYELTKISSTTEGGPNPSWLMLDADNGLLFCLDEGLKGPNGTLTSFEINSDGSLSKIHHVETVLGPVQSHFYSAGDRKYFAIAHYSGSSVTTHALESSGVFTHLQTFTYKLDSPGAVPDRQEAPHPHGVIVDPTGQFVLVPDLGADLVRIFHVNPSTGLLEPQQPLAVSAGSGPRHGTFWTPKGARPGAATDTRFYLASELNSHLTGYKVHYTRNGTIAFDKFFETTAYGGSEPPSGSTAAEIAISPANNHIVLSNRGDNTFGPKNDSISVFSCANARGTSFADVTHIGLYPAYGSVPRQFEISEDDKAIALALQSSHRVAVAGWDDRKGRAGPLLAEKELDGEIVCAVWDS
ncbi:Lactonase, 7-bladed beta-propeller-domain-containing protein [Aspergillus alliaceus]|uniref:Lactonase, 7-bladed beta-propeller-domain-containing protein n=1 Tax=Petromyces alliaceus TaxID=209559 RepID=A0A5N6G8I8_PETAA|nr:Lactonase, 7-bladed beta-propeller-domain-containing protein [Aspergillus alliaceus]KAB8238706.1 Lactonase, 7-bladed beta-propeller-domain-containing protein [Aspergillus alliaceus]KAE8387412.1 Lactonase, 7-bladed beta-propeller-domain-containing protein [Aspergillus alliaceus]